MKVTATDKFEELQAHIHQVPSERDWAIYQAVRVEQWSTRVAAKEFDISQTRVCQIVERTAAFNAQAVTVPTKEDEARQLATGKLLAAERIEYLYGQALSCFRRSQTKEAGCTTTRPNCGDSRYLHAAAKLAMLASTLPPLPLRATENCEKPANEACSATAPEQPSATPTPAQPQSATAAAMVSCVEQSRGKTAATNTAPRPVQNGAGNKAEAMSRRAEFLQTG
jgi:hypothetical protein